MKRTSMTHEFVEYIPRELADGVLYGSIPYCTVVHKCPCGCGNKVVTPISPADWQLAFDGEAISLTPSVGNWSLPCRSHYWIRANQIRWSGSWTDEQVARVRARDDRNRVDYFESRLHQADAVPSGEIGNRPKRRRRPTWFERIRRVRKGNSPP